MSIEDEKSGNSIDFLFASSYEALNAVRYSFRRMEVEGVEVNLVDPEYLAILFLYNIKYPSDVSSRDKKIRDLHFLCQSPELDKNKLEQMIREDYDEVLEVFEVFKKTYKNIVKEVSWGDYQESRMKDNKNGSIDKSES